jgi:hypothetical protein
MSDNLNSGPIEIWHCRVLGGFWAVCGLLAITAITYVLQRDGLIAHWTDGRIWILAGFGALYFGIGAGFSFGRRWARNTMILLMGFTVIILMFLAAAALYVEDGRLLWKTLVCFCIACYTLLFEIVSGIARERRI